MGDVTFMVERKDPPVRTSGKGVWLTRLAPLVDSPGVWFKIAEGPWTAVERMKYSLKKGRYKVPNGRWLYDLVKLGEEAELYAKYVGP